MGDAETIQLYDETRQAWRADGPRPVRTYLWRPEQTGANPQPLIVMSHGSGGAALNLAWLAESLCAEGFLVAAVDHHGNNYPDDLTFEGAAFWWERAPDLSFVADHLSKAENIGAAGVVGYSLGGYTAACILGARIDAGKFQRLYDGEEILPIPPGRPDFLAEMAELIATYGRDALQTRAVGDYTDPRFVAGVLLAPAICRILDDASLAAIRHPVVVRWGDADDVERPEHNGIRYARLIPGADGQSMGEHVGHFEFGDGDEEGAPVHVAVLADVLPFFHEHVGSVKP